MLKKSTVKDAPKISKAKYKFQYFWDWTPSIYRDFNCQRTTHNSFFLNLVTVKDWFEIKGSMRQLELKGQNQNSNKSNFLECPEMSNFQYKFYHLRDYNGSILKKNHVASKEFH